MKDAPSIDPIIPSGKIPGYGMAMMLATAVGSALLVGAVYYGIGKVFDLVILGPLIAGALVGLPIAFVSIVAHCRRPRFSILLGATAAIVMMFSRLYLDSLDFYNNTLPPALAKEANVSLEDAQKGVQDRRAELGQIGSFAEFLKMSADVGVTIEDVGKSHREGESDSPITGMGFWGFMAVDFLLAAIAAGSVCSSIAPKVYCEPCSAWFGQPRSLGIADTVSTDALIAAIRRRDWLSSRMICQNVVRSGSGDYVAFTLRLCPKCSNGAIEVVHHTPAKGKYSSPKARHVFGERLDLMEVKELIKSKETIDHGADSEELTVPDEPTESCEESQHDAAEQAAEEA